ncbi:hypothetical protein [Nostoc sp.]
MPLKKKLIFDFLKKQIRNSGSDYVRLMVYPRVIHFPPRDKPHVIGFGFWGLIMAPNQVCLQIIRILSLDLQGYGNSSQLADTLYISVSEFYSRKIGLY